MGETLHIRTALPADAEACGAVCYEAFAAISREHNFPCDFPGPEATTGLLGMMFRTPGFYAVVAELDGRIVGSNCLYESGVISGVGPISVDPAVQNRRVGHRLMEAVMERACAQGAAGIRLVQAGFHNRTLSLYTKLSFAVREPLACMQGRTLQRTVEGCLVRPATSGDVEACNALCRRVHGFARGLEVEAGIRQGTARVTVRGGNVTAYSSDLAFFGHSVAETNLDLQALLASVESFGGPGILVPTRNSELFRWCLQNGLRITQPMNLMSAGLYNEPAGAWLPSVLF